MTVDVDQWRAKIGLWHAFTVGKPVVRRRRRKPLSDCRTRKHDYQRAYKARKKRSRATQETRVCQHFLPFVALLTLLIVVVNKRSNLNDLQCRITSACFFPPIRLSTILLVCLEKCRSMNNRRNTGVEPPSLFSRCPVVPMLTILIILAGDVELNPGPLKLGK